MEVYIVKRDGNPYGVFSTFRRAYDYALTLKPSPQWLIYIESKKVDTPFTEQMMPTGVWITGKEPSEIRVKEYHEGLERLEKFGGHMLDYINFKRQFLDVVTWMETSGAGREPVNGT
jgi:hypothetical protein